jgi:hypothetical protein
MFNYLNNSISSNSTEADLVKLGSVTLEDIDSIPMYNLRYKGKNLRRESKEVCGEFGGDCFKFAEKYLHMYWTQGDQ